MILGGLGDLASRFLLPGLAELHRVGRLPEDLEIVGVARHDLDDDAYRRHLAEGAGDANGEVEGLASVLERVRYAAADATDADQLNGLDLPGDGPVIFYLALPPAVFADTFRAIARLGLGERVRVAIEKPFGEGLERARELNRVLDECFTADQVFRVDHFLGHPLTRRLPKLRQSPLLAPVWSTEHLASVEIVWDETVALEGRAGYYDGSGALRDMLQNHLLQVLAVATMELDDGDDLATSRLALLRHLHAVPQRSRHARYTAGTIDGEAVPAYVEEEGVDPQRRTETFAELELMIETPRWDGTAVRLRSGKAMGEDRRCMILRFTSTDDHLVFGMAPARLTMCLAGEVVSADLFPGELSAYAAVLGDLCTGDQRWFVSGAEAEEQWRIVTPVLDAWAEGSPELEEYPAGSHGPD